MNARERKLMWGFGGALLVFGAMFLSTVGISWAKELFAENDRLRDRVSELRQLVDSRSDWEERENWLDETVPHFASRQEASAALLESLENLDRTGISLQSRQLTEPAGDKNDEQTGNSYFEATSVKLELEAPEAALYRWIHQLHQPDTFRGVTSLTIERADEGRLRAEIDLTQFYLQ
jgi:hypothetical protein